MPGQVNPGSLIYEREVWFGSSLDKPWQTSLEGSKSY